MIGVVYGENTMTMC